MLENGMLDYSNLPPEKQMPFFRTSRTTERHPKPSFFDLQRDRLLQSDFFHGVLSRDEAEKRVTNNGCFLVRESLSMRCFVVTTRWNGHHYHIAIRPTASQPAGLFHFEDTYSFDSVEELIVFYKDSQTPVSRETGAILFTPVSVRAGAERTSGTPRYQQRSRGNSGSRTRQATKAKAQRLKKFGSEPLLLVEGETQSRSRRGSHASTDGASSGHEDRGGCRSAIKSARSLSSVASADSAQQNAKNVRRGSAGSVRVTSAQQLSAPRVSVTYTSRREAIASTGPQQAPELPPPPKPQRPLPRHSAEVFNRPRPNIIIRDRARYLDDGNDYTDYAQVMAISSIVRQGTLQSSTDDYIPMGNGNLPLAISTNQPQRKLSLPSDQMATYVDNYGPLPSPDPLIDAQMWNIWLNHGFLPLGAPNTEHLPDFVKPLDSTVWTTVLRVLADASPELLCSGAAQESCRLLFHYPQSCKIPLIRSGFQLMLLPKAESYRQQLLERDYCLSRFVAASILICKSHERASIVIKWLAVAECLYSVYRDYFSLHSVIDGIFCHQVVRLVNPVTMISNPSPLATAIGRDIRILHSHSDDCSLSPHADICVPHVSRFLRCFNAAFDDLRPESLESLSDVAETARIWAETDPERLWVANLPSLPAPPVLPEMFRTEVQMKLLWGARGYTVPSVDRQQKLEVILDAFAKRAHAKVTER